MNTRLLTTGSTARDSSGAGALPMKNVTSGCAAMEIVEVRARGK